MSYAFVVRVERNSQVMGKDHYEFTVVALKAEEAISKALKQARKDSGWKGLWYCTRLERGGWIVS